MNDLDLLCEWKQDATWKSIGARGLATGVELSVADFRMAVSKPPMATTFPACACCKLSRPRPIIVKMPSTYKWQTQISGNTCEGLQLQHGEALYVSLL